MLPSDHDGVVLIDDFTSKELDWTKWNVQTTGKIFNNEQQAYIDSPSTLYLRDELEGASGVLVIQPRFVKGFVTPQGNTFDFVSGRINTRNKIQMTYGSISARIKLPVGDGLWPAFWLLGSQGAWPGCGELDIMESVGEADWISAAVHGPNYSGETALVSKKYFDPPDDAAQWHIYSLDWSPDSLNFMVDGKPVNRVPRQNVEFVGQWVFDKPQFIVINLALGGNYPYKINGIYTPYYGLPASTVEAIANNKIKMLVDWVKVKKNNITIT
jgi:beta-glucanase (GH16 family)